MLIKNVLLIDHNNILKEKLFLLKIDYKMYIYSNLNGQILFPWIGHWIKWLVSKIFFFLFLLKILEK